MDNNLRIYKTQGDNLMKGHFVSFEGIDGSGKSTQAKRLCEYIKSLKRNCTIVREPGGTLEGERIREILLDEKSNLTPESELFLFLASRSVLTKRVVLPALERGDFVIADRYSDSSLAYQGYGRGVDLKIVEYGNDIATYGIRPEIVFYIDIPVEIAMSRKNYSDRMEKEDFLKRVREGYLKLAERLGYLKIDGTMKVDDIWKVVKKAVDDLIGGGRA